MRTIEISTAVYAKIWSHRLDGEEDEDSILRRLLGLGDQNLRVVGGKQTIRTSASKTLWRDDVRSALSVLGDEAHLDEIYSKVREIRLTEGRSLPTNFKAIIRRELEYNSSDSNVYQERFDWFRSVEGIGQGVWALRMGSEALN